MKKLMAAAAVAAMVGVAGPAMATDFDFSGSLTNHNDILLVTFTASAATTVTLFSSSWDDGGFDPMLGLWDSNGTLITWQDDGRNIGSTSSNGVLYDHGNWDSYYSYNIVNAGTYTVSLSTFYNTPNGTTLADGFAYDSEAGILFANWYEPSNGYKTGAYEFHVLNVDTATSNAVPEPTTMLLFGTGLVGLAAVNRRRSQK